MAPYASSSPASAQDFLSDPRMPRLVSACLSFFSEAAPLPPLLPLPIPSAEVAAEALPGSPSASWESGATAEGAIQPFGF